MTTECNAESFLFQPLGRREVVARFVRRITGASQRQLTYWDATGLLKPSGKDTGHRRYTFPDVVAAKTIIALRQKGCSLKQIRRAVEHLRKCYPHDAGPDALASLTVLSDG